MPQFVNEYEGFGNALMNIGEMYAAKSEREKEEKRRKQEMLEAEARRKAEKLEDRTYAEGQAELERKRTAPLDELKMRVQEIKAQRELMEANRPRIHSGGGGMLLKQTPKYGEDGSYAGFDETIIQGTPRASTPRSNAHRTVVRDGRLMQFNDATQAYDKDIGAAGSPKSTKSEDPIKKATGLMQSAAALREKASNVGEGNPLADKYNQQADILESTGAALMEQGVSALAPSKPAPADSPDDYAASFAQVKQARPNWTDSMITDYLARKGITKKG